MSEAATAERVSSFSKALALGEIHEDVVFPYPIPRGEEAEKVRGLIEGFRAYAAEHIDSREIDETGTISDQVYRDLGELGLMGLYVDEEYGGQGLSQTGYARVFEAIGQVDGSLTIGMGVHQSIGLKGIHLFGTDEQKARFLPDLASGRKLAGFALTEPEAGSDAYNIQTRAVQQSDGSWVLNGEKRWIGNGCRGDVLTVFARAEVDGKDSHIALILEKGMKGFDQSGAALRDDGPAGATTCARVRFNDVRVPPENVLGEPGEGFHIAMQVLNNGRIGLGTGAVGLAKRLLDLAIEHVTTRRQFGKTLSEFDMVEEKIGWMVSYLFGLESMAYLTTGLIDAGIEDYSVESAIAKISGTEFVWYQANRALQLAGGAGLHARPALRADPARHPDLPDLRGRQRRDALVRRAQRAQAAGGGARGTRRPRPRRPDRRRSARWRTTRSAASSARCARTGSRARTRSCRTLADPVGDQVKRLRGEGEGLLREHGKGIVDQGIAPQALLPTRSATSTRRSPCSRA